MNPYFYSDTISNFITASTNEIFDAISRSNDFPDDPNIKNTSGKLRDATIEDCNLIE